MTSQDRRCRDRNRGVSDAGERPQLSGSETSAPQRRGFDAGLLLRCMGRLQIDRGEVANEDPLLLRDLQGVCAWCRSRAECVEDLAREFDDARRGAAAAYLTKLRYDARASIWLRDNFLAIPGIGGPAAT